MKNILKYFILFLCLSVLFGLTGCPGFIELDVPLSASGIKITISGDGAGARTLFPSAPNFTRYELQFLKTNGADTYGNLLLDVKKAEILIEDLALGEWEITAIGYITINGNFVRAADGKAVIDVKPGSDSSKTAFQSVNIPIRSKPGTGSGNFFYNVDFPSSIHTAELYIYDIGGSPWDVFDEHVTTPLGGNAPINILNNKTGNITLSAGYYMMTMKFDNGYKAISWTEVIHIYTNMETRMEKVFDENYISGAITLSGKASVLINGVQADWASLYIYSDINYSNNFAHLDANNSQLFPITMQAFEAPTTFYVKLNAGIGDSFFTRRLGAVTLFQNDYVFDVNEVFKSINVGGTSKITINGNKPLEAYVYAYRAENNELLTVNPAMIDTKDGKNGSWGTLIESFNEETEIYFEVQAVSAGAIYYKRIEGSVWLFNANRTNIHLEADVALLTVSGTANITINGTSARYAGITMRKVVLNGDGEEIIGDFLDHYEIDYSIGNTFEFSIDYLKEPVQAYFEYRCKDINDNYFEGTFNSPRLTLHNVNETGVSLNVNISIINLSGTANISVNGAAPKGAFVTMYRSSDNVQFGYSEIDFRAQIEDDKGEFVSNPNYLIWDMTISPFTENTGVYFVVSGADSKNEFFEKKAHTMDVYNQSLSGIELNVDINAVDITISGTISITHGFKPPEGVVEIIALVDGVGRIGDTAVSSDPGAKEWTITVKSFDASTTVRFMFRWTISGETFSYFPSLTATMHESNVSGISLGSRTLNPSYPFDDTGSEPKWTANINPAWLFDGKKVTAGECYALEFTFVTQSDITDLDAVIRDLTLCNCGGGVHTCYNDSLLSDVRRVQSNRDSGSTLTGTVVFTVSKSASSSDKLANTLHFMVPGATSDRPTLIFSNLKITKINKYESAETWAIKVNGNDDVLKVVGPGVTTIATVQQFKDRNDVLFVEPGDGGYYHFVVEYDLSAYAGKRININIKTDYWIESSTRIAWQVTAVPGSTTYPTVCGSTTQLNASTEWDTMETNVGNTNTSTVNVPPASTPGDDGKKLYLSALQLGGAGAHFSNFTMTITEQ